VSQTEVSSGKVPRPIHRRRRHSWLDYDGDDAASGGDAVKKMPYMVEFADQVKLKKTTDWMKAHWMTA
jgi:hypothetical protein